MNDKEQIIGHQKQKSVLERFLVASDAHHAFLFTGPESIGKKMIARAFAYQLIHDDHVKNIWVGHHKIDGDLIEVTPRTEHVKSRTVIRDISVEQIRNAQAAFALTAEAHARVLVIDDAHRMTIAAQNALLKTLEEPTGKRAIILIGSDYEQLLDTIISRCMHVRFSLLPQEELFALSHDKTVVENAQGRPGYIRRMEQDEMFLMCVNDAREKLKGLAKTHVHERMQLAMELTKKDEQYVQTFFSVWIHRIWTVAHLTKKYHLIKLSGKIEDALTKMNTSNANRQLIIEDLLLHIV